MSDQDRSSPYNMNTMSSRQLMVIRKIDIKEIDFFFFNHFHHDDAEHITE